MLRNNGMRPQDVAVLIKILLFEGASWMKKDLATSLFISQAEVGHSLNRSDLAGLVNLEQKMVMKRTFIEFLFHGFPYVFPVRPGRLLIGMPTSYSAPVLKKYIVSSEPVVWPYPEGNIRGQRIEPLYKGVVEASRADPKFYDVMCLCDSLRIGKVREKEKARDLLRQKLFVS